MDDAWKPPTDRHPGSISTIAMRVLRYLMEHPAAGDTAEGILDWWLAQRGSSVEMKSVEQALDDLEHVGLITVLRAADNRSHYRLNADRIDGAKALLKEQDSRQR
jgi:Fe2+ or Zn2+ uptake regulation protein